MYKLLKALSRTRKPIQFAETQPEDSYTRHCNANFDHRKTALLSGLFQTTKSASTEIKLKHFQNETFIKVNGSNRDVLFRNPGEPGPALSLRPRCSIPCC